LQQQQQQQQQQVLIHEMGFACKTAKRNKTHQKLNMFIQSSPFSDLQSGGAYDPFTKKQMMMPICSQTNT
jgi:hypothetical protein